MGLARQPEHDRRYDQADEYLQVLYQLLEGSWADDAVIADTARRIYADPSRVRKVRHRGEFYAVEGYHLCEPSPQRTPVLFQAGSSKRGLQFAGEHAECVFISGQDKSATRAQVERVRAAVRASGRDPQGVKLFMGITVIVAETEQQARAKHADYLRHASPEAGVAHFAASTGIDFAEYGPDQPIAAATGNAIQSATQSLQTHTWTRRRLLDKHALGGRYVTLVGSAEQVTDQLLAWIDETGLDGFNLTRTVTPESYLDFIELVIPELQRRGRFKTAYAQGTLREKLLQQGSPHLSPQHPGAAYRQPLASTGVLRHA